VPAGQQLKTLRNRCNITVREVEQASRRIAAAKGDKRFRISNGWLAQLENGMSEPSISKLFSLSVIYHANFLDLIRLYDVDVNHKEKYERVANPHITQLFSPEDSEDLPQPADLDAPLQCHTRLMPELKTTTNWMQVLRPEDQRDSIVYGYIGKGDFTMYPLIRPGSFLRIDTKQNKLRSSAWRNEYERPIYFIELRGAYACGWCELQGNQLLIIPHQSSPASIRRFTYPREAEIVGRVTGYNTTCVDRELDTSAKEPKVMRAKNNSK